MIDREQLLLNAMSSKLNEAKSYTNISVMLTILFLIDFVLVLLGFGQFNSTYFLILALTFLGNQHMSKKYKKAIKEYEQLKEEYESII